MPRPGASGARPPAAWLRDLTVLGQKYVVELLPAAEQSSGGVWLPERYQENWTHGRVIAAGPGEACGDERSIMWLKPGDEALFTRHSFHSFGDPHTHGWVRDDDVIAAIRDGDMWPLNDWVMIQQDPDEPDPSAAIAYAEEWRPKPTHGRVLEMGPGARQWKGDLWGVRRPVRWTMGFPDGTVLGDPCRRCPVFDSRVWWGRDHEMLSVGREHLEALFIRAEDLLFFEED